MNIQIQLNKIEVSECAVYDKEKELKDLKGWRLIEKAEKDLEKLQKTSAKLNDLLINYCAVNNITSLREYDTHNICSQYLEDEIKFKIEKL